LQFVDAKEHGKNSGWLGFQRTNASWVAGDVGF
jgi:hypothetical protein